MYTYSILHVTVTAIFVCVLVRSPEQNPLDEFITYVETAVAVHFFKFCKEWQNPGSLLNQTLFSFGFKIPFLMNSKVIKTSYLSRIWNSCYWKNSTNLNLHVYRTVKFIYASFSNLLLTGCQTRFSMICLSRYLLLKPLVAIGPCKYGIYLFAVAAVHRGGNG